MTKHENYKELIWTLAKTDFKLRYHGSFLGYVWAILKPLLIFLVLNFVFSSVFNPRNTGTNYFSLQLLTSIMLFTFFQEGTKSGLIALMEKSTLVNKIYIPRWTIILASTINTAMIFLMNLIVVAAFFVYYQYLPDFFSILMFVLFSVLTYILVLAFSFIAAPLYLKFRDLQQIWEVVLSAMFYATPIVYPLSILPPQYHKIILLNPIAFVIHFTKTSLTENRYPELNQMLIFLVFILIGVIISFLTYRKLAKRIAETI